MRQGRLRAGVRGPGTCPCSRKLTRKGVKISGEASEAEWGVEFQDVVRPGRAFETYKSLGGMQRGESGPNRLGDMHKMLLRCLYWQLRRHDGTQYLRRMIWLRYTCSTANRLRTPVFNCLQYAMLAVPWASKACACEEAWATYRLSLRILWQLMQNQHGAPCLVPCRSCSWFLHVKDRI